jgi:tRNA dimethylallyltransferase
MSLSPTAATNSNWRAKPVRGFKDPRAQGFEGHPRVLAIVGPTGVGKTALGVALANAFDAEIINADSRQVYRRLDVGSAKPTLAERAAVPHHVIDVVEPNEPFDCARFRCLATAAIHDVVGRGKRALVVGGTGLYLKVLRGGVFAGPGRDPVLRAELERAEDSEPGTLYARLRALDPAGAARLHPHDRMRLIRALEVYQLTGRPISAWQAEHAFATRDFDMRVLGLTLPRPELYARINARCESMVRQGLVDEIRGLYASGFDPQLPALRSPGYHEIGEYVRGLCDLPTAIARMSQATRRLAKRQLIWFRADPEIVWCPPEPAALQREAEAFWSVTGP